MSKDYRRVRIQKGAGTTDTDPPPADEHQLEAEFPDLTDFPHDNIFHHQIAGIQIIAKPKRKRWESSVSILEYLVL